MPFSTQEATLMSFIVLAPAGAPVRKGVRHECDPWNTRNSRFASCPGRAERQIYAVMVVVSLGLWLVLLVEYIGIAYAVVIGLVVMLGRALLITHVRGNGVRLGPDQLPDLHQRVVAISTRLGLPRTPEAYVLQQGGALNAFATKFFGTNFIVLYSDLLDACGDNSEACDFIVAHELGHLRAGHLRDRWLILPALFVPFLGSAYSRACEYTSDRYGLAGTRDHERALEGLVVLAVGGREANRINRRALVAQTRQLQGFWMNIGQWLSSHPPIAHRLGVLDPALASERVTSRGAALAAVVIVALALTLPVLGGVGLLAYFRQIQAAARQEAVAPPVFDDAPAGDTAASPGVPAVVPKNSTEEPGREP